MMDDEVLLEKQRQLKERLALAGQQVEILERLASSSRRIDKIAFQFARAEFNKLIPSGKVAFGCKSTCMIFCHCSDHLFKPEKLERHKLYMRYFDAKEAYENLDLEVEQASLDLPTFKNRAETVQKRKPKKTQQTAYREVQFEIEI